MAALGREQSPPARNPKSGLCPPARAPRGKVAPGDGRGWVVCENQLWDLLPIITFPYLDFLFWK